MPPRILLFGKTRSITHLIEDVAEDLRLSGHDVLILSYRANKLAKMLEPWLLSPRLGVPLAAHAISAVRRFRPDLILGIGPFHWLPPAVFEPLAAMPGRPPMVAWIGDLFDAGLAGTAALFDAVAYTDSGMVELHRAFGFSSRPIYLPLAASRGATARPVSPRSGRLAFVASATPGRRALLAAVEEPVALFGPDWKDGEGTAGHVLTPRKIAATELPGIYAGHLGALNIRHELNVVSGLNQRHFAPYVVGTPVAADMQPDLERCFDPGAEILIYRDAAELTDLCRRMRADPVWAGRIGEAGRRRVLAEHLHAHRIAALIRELGR